MEPKPINLFILGDNALIITGLKHDLEKRFGIGLRIYNFYDFKSCLRNINEADVIVLDSMVNGKSANDVSRQLKASNPAIKIIPHSVTSDIIAAIEAMVEGKIPEPETGNYNGKIANQIY
jgi:DNA-binding NarL/FixJ family response regulator